MKEKIKEYAGTNFYFLIDFLHGNYENYVRENITKITHKNVFGKLRLRDEYKGMSGVQITNRVLDICEKTLKYIK